MIATSGNNITSAFGFSYKSATLSKLYDESICSLCICFTEDITDPDAVASKISTFVKDYKYTGDTENGVINHFIIILPATTNCLQFSTNPNFESAAEKHRFSYFKNSGTPTYLLYNEMGEWSTTDCKIESGSHLASLVAEIKLNGIYNIFEKGNGILVSGPGHHYVLQNKYHADKFIRTANILTNSTYVDFLAIFLLPFISVTDTVIYIDTSGIISIAYAVNKLKQIFLKSFNPAILSFNSYEGIKDLTNDGNTKVIISASTSGKLSKLLLEQGFSKEKINILFYLNEMPPNVEVLCNLTVFQKLNKTEKYTPFKIETETSCSLCNNYSYPIKIVGEQFLPEELRVDTFMFDLKDRPIWLTKFINTYFKKHDIVKCFYQSEEKYIKRDLYLDFEKILKIATGAAGNKVERFFSSKLPNEIDVLIYYNDNGSVYLKDLILKKYKSGPHIAVLADDDINANKATLTEKNILVVSSTITNGRRLVDTSLKLRDLDSKGISYFVAMARTADELTIETTRKYIGFDNKFGPEINPLHIIDVIYISDTSKSSTFSEANASSWEAEINLFTTELTAPCFSKRLEELNTNKGLTDTLFWPNAIDEQLTLRKNFAFYTGTACKTEHTSQAEVFFIINSVLHNLRRNKSKNIFQSAFHRHVISPEIFIQYNDGVIQASILRSANPIELNYSFQGNNLTIGTEMINVLRYIFSNFDNDTGEATIEFLISIASKRLQLINKELHKVINSLITKVTASESPNKEIILNLCNYILKMT